MSSSPLARCDVDARWISTLYVTFCDYVNSTRVSAYAGPATRPLLGAVRRASAAHAGAQEAYSRRYACNLGHGGLVYFVRLGSTRPQ